MFRLCLVVGALRLFFCVSCSCLLLVLTLWARVVMHVAVSVSSFCLALLQRKSERCSHVHSMLASSFLCPVLLLLVQCCCVVLPCFLVHVHAQRRRPLGIGLHLPASQLCCLKPPLRADPSAPLVSFSLFLIMADAPAPAAPRQQRRKEARAQAQDDSRRVRQRLDDLESRLEALEGRSRGHDLRLQYLEAPLKLVLKKFKAPVEFWASKDAGLQAAKSAFSAAFMQELREVGGATIQHLLEEAEPIIAELDSQVVIGVFRTGGSSQDRDGAIIPDRLHPGDQGSRLGYLLSNMGRHLGDERVVHTDRPRKHQGEKGKGQG